jgi:hypothetical protein
MPPDGRQRSPVTRLASALSRPVTQSTSSVSTLEILAVVFRGTVRTDAVTEVRGRAPSYVLLEAHPRSVILTHLLAEAADRDDAFESWTNGPNHRSARRTTMDEDSQ